MRDEARPAQRGHRQAPAADAAPSRPYRTDRPARGDGAPPRKPYPAGKHAASDKPRPAYPKAKRAPHGADPRGGGDARRRRPKG